MATNRKAARQQRLRGAQTREPQDVDFAFTLPAPPAPPAPAPASASRTTRSEVTPSSARVARAVPTRGGGVFGSTTSTRSGSSRKRTNPKTPSEDRAEKRQRIDNNDTSLRDGRATAATGATLGIGDPRAEEMGQLPAHVTTRTPRREISAEDELSSSINAVAFASSQLSIPRPSTAEEVTESPRNAPGSGRRQTLSSDPVPTADTPTKPSMRATETNQTPKSTNQRRTKRDSRQMHTVPSPEFDSSQLADTTTTPRNKKQQKDDGEIDELSPNQPRKTRPGDRHADEEDNEDEASEIPDVEAAKQLTSRRRRRSDGPAEEEPQEESDIRETEAEATTTSNHRSRGKRGARRTPSGRGVLPAAIASPAQQRAPKTRPAAVPTTSKPRPKPKPKQSNKPTSTAPRKHPGGGAAASRKVVSVTAYRMTRHHTTTAGGASDSDSDILTRAIPFASRSTVNAVDVLSQACDEFSSSALEALSEGAMRAEDESSLAERREYRTKLRAVEAFAEEVRWKLMELTINLDAEYALRKRVRAVVKEKGELRTELMRLRAEREKVALMMDAARMKHEEEGKKNESLMSLSTALNDISLAVSLGRDNNNASATSPDGSSLTDSPLPILLEQVAASASKTSKEGGLLRRLREFNGFLERVASAVEGR